MSDLIHELRQGAYHCDDYRWRAADEITLLRDENKKLRAEVSELNSMFDARWSADMRAIECWRKVNPGNELVLPDHVDLSLWLMEERTRLTARVKELEGALSTAAHRLAGAMLSHYAHEAYSIASCAVRNGRR